MHRWTNRTRLPARIRALRTPLRFASWLTRAAVCLAATAAFAQEPISGTDALNRGQAVQRARDGQFEPAIEVLDELRSRYPENASLLHDQIVVLAWAGRDADAFELARSLDPATLPTFVSLPVAKAARNLRQFDAAIEWYSAARLVDPGDEQALLGLLLTYGDNRDAAGVRATIHALSELGFEDSEVELATAYSLRSIGDSFEALALYDTVLTANPNEREALRGKALVLRSMLLPTQALEIARANPGVLTPQEVARLESDEAAIRVRLASRTSLPAPSVYQATDSAIAYVDERLGQSGDSGDPAATLALKLDRIVALVDANRTEDAIAAFEALPADVRSSQAYVLGAIAQAYLEQQRPSDALDAVRQAIRLDPGNIDYRFTLVYAYVDLERFDDALELALSLTAALPVSNSAADGAIEKVNEPGMRAQLLAGIIEAYADQFRDAQTRLEMLLAGAPNNADARHELANVYRWRGWLDRSLFEYRQVLTNDSELLSARLGHAHAQIDAREYEAVDATVTALETAYSREPAARRLIDRWNLHNKSELIVSGTTIRSSGNTFGSSGHTVDTTWYTAPLAYRYRAFVHALDSRASFPEGNGDRRRVGAGVQYRAPRWTAAGELSSGSGTDGLGIAGTMDWRLSDYWTIGGTLELNSYQTQLRAHRTGIDSDQAGVSATFAASESASATFGIGYVDYSDGNTQHTLYTDGHFRLMNHPRSKLDLIGSFSLSASETALVPYFSPEDAGMLLAGLQHEFRIFRRYSHSVTQRARATTGRYDQSSTPGGSIWRVAYELDWQISDGLSLSAGIERRSDYYDALREHSTYGLVAVNARF